MSWRQRGSGWQKPVAPPRAEDRPTGLPPVPPPHIPPDGYSGCAGCKQLAKERDEALRALAYSEADARGVTPEDARETWRRIDGEAERSLAEAEQARRERETEQTRADEQTAEPALVKAARVWEGDQA